jgi:hypothetical protein
MVIVAVRPRDANAAGIPFVRAAAAFAQLPRPMEENIMASTKAIRKVRGRVMSWNISLVALVDFEAVL